MFLVEVVNKKRQMVHTICLFKNLITNSLRPSLHRLSRHHPSRHRPGYRHHSPSSHRPSRIHTNRLHHHNREDKDLLPAEPCNFHRQPIIHHNKDYHDKQHIQSPVLPACNARCFFPIVAFWFFLMPYYFLLDSILEE